MTDTRCREIGRWLDEKFFDYLKHLMGLFFDKVETELMKSDR